MNKLIQEIRSLGDLKTDFVRKAIKIILLTFAVIYVAFICLESFWQFELKKQVDIGILTTVPLFVLALLQLGRNHQIERSKAINEFLAKFLSNEEVYSAFYELIYCYHDSKLDE